MKQISSINEVFIKLLNVIYLTVNQSCRIFKVSLTAFFIDVNISILIEIYVNINWEKV